MASFGNISNLLEETIDVLNDHKLTFDDVLWIGCDYYTISIEQFKELANTTYDKGFGAPKVAIGLKIVGQNWWLEREEYDGLEWWEFNAPSFRQLHLANVTLKTQHDTVPKQDRALIDAARAIGLSEIDIGRLLAKTNQIMEDTNND